MPMIIVRNSLVVLMCVLGLGACGFKLAGSAQLPQQMASIYLVTSDISETQRKALRDTLSTAGAKLVEQEDSQSVRLSVSLKVLPDQQLATGGSSGDIVKRISRSLDFNLKGADGNTIIPPSTLRQQKDITLNDNQLLSSAREKKTVASELEQSLYNQLIRQLSLI